jgi:hypothetical protein
MYDFRKIYADLVAPDGTVCIVYRTWVRLLRTWHERSGFELHGPDGARTVYLGRGGDGPPDPDASAMEIPLRFRVEGGTFELLVEEARASFDPGPACDGLTWSVKLGNGGVCARGPGINLAGRGYMDLVRLTRFTRSLGMRELAWGRAHAGESTFVWTALRFRGGRSWRMGARWAGTARATGAPEVVVDASGSGRVTIAEQTVSLEPTRTLADGDAFDRERIPDPIDRLVTRAIGGPTHQVRWRGRAIGPTPGESGDALYERVRFGARRDEEGVPT